MRLTSLPVKNRLPLREAMRCRIGGILYRKVLRKDSEFLYGVLSFRLNEWVDKKNKDAVSGGSYADCHISFLGILRSV